MSLKSGPGFPQTLLTGLTLPYFVPVPSQDLDFQCHNVVIIFVFHGVLLVDIDGIVGQDMVLYISYSKPCRNYIGGVMVSMLTSNVMVSMLTSNVMVSMLTSNVMVSMLTSNVMVSMLTSNVMVSMLTSNVMVSMLTSNVMVSMLTSNVMVSMLTSNVMVSMLTSNVMVSMLTSNVMVSMLTSNAVDCGFEPWSGQTMNYKIANCCLSAKQAALCSKSKN